MAEVSDSDFIRCYGHTRSEAESQPLTCFPCLSRNLAFLAQKYQQLSFTVQKISALEDFYQQPTLIADQPVNRGPIRSNGLKRKSLVARAE